MNSVKGASEVGRNRLHTIGGGKNLHRVVLVVHFIISVQPFEIILAN